MAQGAYNTTTPDPAFDPNAGGPAQGPLDAATLLKFIMGGGTIASIIAGTQSNALTNLGLGPTTDPTEPNLSVTAGGPFDTGPRDFGTPSGIKAATVVDNTFLPSDARAHQHDYAWMTSHGYKPYETPIVNMKRGAGFVPAAPTVGTGIRWEKPVLPDGTPDALRILAGDDRPSASPEAIRGAFAGQKGLPVSAVAPRPTKVAVSAVTLGKTLLGMDPDQLTVLQRKLSDGGYFKQNEHPTFGVLDDATEAAYGNAMRAAFLQPGKSFDEVIDSTSDLAKARTDRDAKAAQAMAEAGLDKGPLIKVTDAAALDQTISQAASTLIGHNLDPEERRRFIDAFHASESDEQRTTYERAVAQAVTTAQGASDTQVNGFLDQIAALNAHHIGGNVAVGAYGIQVGDWKSWLKRIGLPDDMTQTPDNERTVARELLLTYHDRTNSWQEAATAFLSGAGDGVRLWNPAVSTAVTWTDLAKRVSSQMPAAGTAGLASQAEMLGSLPGTTVSNAPTADQAALSYLQTNHPVEYLGTDLADRASKFLTMLGASAPTGGSTANG